MKLYYFLVGYRSRWHHWNCGGLAHWLQRTLGMVPKPSSATGQGWNEWRDANRKSHPITYWITEELFNGLQDVVYFPHDVYINFYNKFRNAFVTKTHIIPTNLKIGGWYDCDTRIVKGLFALLIEFVEQEKANMQRWSHSGEEPKTNREDGMTYLDWEISLGEESKSQAASAEEIKEIYLWVKDVRPNRPDPDDVTGWSDHCANRGDNLFLEEKTEEDKNKVKKILADLHALEQKYKDEDTEMLIRIIKIRESMWT